MPDATPTVKARPTTYKGVQMRSRLEAGFAQWLDRWRVSWAYEPRCFASDKGQYLPDFVLEDVRVGGMTLPVYIEVKPSVPLVEAMQANLAILKASDVFSQLAVCTPPPPDAFEPKVLLVSDRGFREWIWTVRPGRRLSIERPMSYDEGPWVGEFWKPGN